MAHHTTDPHTLARAAQQRAIGARRKRLQRQAKAETAPPKGCATLPTLSPTQRQGQHAEDLAMQYLQAAGLRPLARNLACRAGEIDLVCRDGDTLVFIEVRQRLASRYGGAAASIGLNKQQRLIKAALYWLPLLSHRHFQGRLPPCRFDAVVLDNAQIRWIRHAFALPCSR